MSGTVAPRFASVAHGRPATRSCPGCASRSPPTIRTPATGSSTTSALTRSCTWHSAPSRGPGLLAGHARRRGIPFVFTSTTMVFAPRPDGPYTITSPRTATDEYGAYKIRCEDAVWAGQPGRDGRPARVPDRSGWRSATTWSRTPTPSRRPTGSVRASPRWIPACAFLDDTAAALLSLVPTRSPACTTSTRNARTAWTPRAHPAQPRGHARTAVADRRDRRAGPRPAADRLHRGSPDWTARLT